MKFPRVLIIALLALAAQISALGAEVAVLRNGRSISFVRKEQLGNTTRLYTADGYVDILTEQIGSFEAEETPPAPPQPEMPAQTPPAATPQAATSDLSNQQTVGNGKVDLDELVREASKRRQLDPDFVSSVIKAESNFKTRAVSSKGAQGLMQLMPETAAQLGVSNSFDPRANVEAGTTYLSQLLDLYHDDPVLALAAYNAGPQRVQQYHGVPPYRETHAYIARIVRDFNAKKAAQNAGRAQVSAKKGLPPAANQKAAVVSKTTAKKKVQQASAPKPLPTSGTN
ncbi:MAG TPA: lytic transglycosylase domain-containing protein [Candidatus Angelobacter sp.]